jgi:hypothetical protein
VGPDRPPRPTPAQPLVMRPALAPAARPPRAPPAPQPIVRLALATVASRTCGVSLPALPRRRLRLTPTSTPAVRPVLAPATRRPRATPAPQLVAHPAPVQAARRMCGVFPLAPPRRRLRPTLKSTAAVRLALVRAVFGLRRLPAPLTCAEILLLLPAVNPPTTMTTAAGRPTSTTARGKTGPPLLHAQPRAATTHAAAGTCRTCPSTLRLARSGAQSTATPRSPPTSCPAASSTSVSPAPRPTSALCTSATSSAGSASSGPRLPTSRQALRSTPVTPAPTRPSPALNLAPPAARRTRPVPSRRPMRTPPAPQRPSLTACARTRPPPTLTVSSSTSSRTRLAATPTPTPNAKLRRSPPARPTTPSTAATTSPTSGGSLCSRRWA